MVPERLTMAARHGAQAIDAKSEDHVPGAIREMTDGRGPDSVIDAVGMEAHGAPRGQAQPGRDRLLAGPDRREVREPSRSTA